MVYTVTLNPALDYVLKLENLRQDDINRAYNEALYYGGKGINVSAVLTRLGVENKALGVAAGFTGQELERRLKADGIECEFVFLKSGSTRINVKIKAEAEFDINAEGPDISEEDINELLTKLDSIKNGDYLVLSGSAPKALSDNIYERILKRLEGKGINFVIDGAGDLLLNTLKHRPFLIKPNHHELGDLFSVELSTDEEIETYAKKLQALGARNVLVSRAENGATLIDINKNVIKIKNAEGKLLNSTGCGDSMVAGFIAGFIKSGDYIEAIKLGTACANATAYSEGLADRSKIENILQVL